MVFIQRFENLKTMTYTKLNNNKHINLIFLLKFQN
jgi:hypothetical protein